MKLKQIIKNKKAFSLIEMLVSVGIFSMIFLAITSIFIQITRGQRNLIASENIQENMRFIMEMLSKEIRTAKISNDDCSASAINKVYNTFNSDTELYFKNEEDECVRYYLNNNALFIERGGGAHIGDLKITPDEIKITNLEFIVLDDNIASLHTKQAQVTIKMDVEYNTDNEIDKHKMTVQTSISSRYYE